MLQNKYVFFLNLFHFQLIFSSPWPSFYLLCLWFPSSIANGHARLLAYLLQLVGYIRRVPHRLWGPNRIYFNHSNTSCVSGVAITRCSTGSVTTSMKKPFSNRKNRSRRWKEGQICQSDINRKERKWRWSPTRYHCTYLPIQKWKMNEFVSVNSLIHNIGAIEFQTNKIIMCTTNRM